MKKRNLIIVSTATLLCLSAGGVLAFKNNKMERAGASPTVTTTTPPTVSSLPTTIDLNDLGDTDIRSYYASAAGLSGTDLLTQLKTIIITNPLNTSNAAQYYSYANVRKIYKMTDRQWSLYNVNGYSGSNSISSGTYSSSTNKITGYAGYSSETTDDPYLHFYYRDDNTSNPHTFSTKQTGTTTSGTTGSHSMLCQEHLWSKSLGFSQGSGVPNAGSDLHHLVAADYAVNSWAHSNLCYGYVNEPANNNDFTDAATRWGPNESLSGQNAIINNKVGTPTNFTEVDTGSLKVFEPQDCDKGDIARALLYMVARYNWFNATDNSSVTEPYLELGNKVINSTKNSSAGAGAVPFGCLNDLLTWHFNDLPDEYEIHRNNIIYNNYQHTRNPFIDFPEWVSYIWGRPQTNPTSASNKYVPTGTANPSSDSINTLNPTGTVSVTGVSVSPNTASIGVNGTVSLTATISPSNASNKSVSWTTSSSSIATVSSSGVVTGKAVGTATITATTADGGFTSSCNVTVSSSIIPVTGVTVSPATLSLETGNSSTLTATISPSNATNTSVLWTSDNTTIASVNSSGVVTANKKGTANITVTSSDGGYTATCVVTVSNPSGTGESTTISSTMAAIATANGWTTASGSGTQPCYTSFNLDTVINISTTGTANCGSYWSNGWRLYQAKNGNVIVTASDGYIIDSVTFTFTNYNDGILIDSSSNTITSGSELTVDDSSVTYTVSDTNTSTNSGQIRITNISVTYHSTSSGGDPVLSSIVLDTSGVSKVFAIGDTFSYDGLIVTAYYNDGSNEIVTPDSVTGYDMTTAGTQTVTVSFGTKTATYGITVYEEAATSITATVSKTYTVGECINRQDISVVDSNDMVITDFDFEDDGYQFVYADAASGGSATNKSFIVSSGALSTTMIVSVSRVAYHSAATDTLDNEFIGVTGNNYSPWDNKVGTSYAVYAGITAGGNSAIQMRITNSNEGIVSTKSSCLVASVTVSWNSNTASGRTINIYGSNAPYTSTSELFNESTQGTLLGTLTNGETSLNVSGEYLYIGIRSANGALYLDSIAITYSAASATNMANYIMYEDTTNQCTTKLNTAIGYFNGLSANQRSAFMTSIDYVIASARERFEAWATHEGKVITYSGGDYIVENAGNSAFKTHSNQGIILLLVIVGSINISGVILYFVFKKKRERQ